MIFVTKADCEVTYVSPEWCAFTGQAASAALGHGWLDSVHPDDRETAGNFLRCASDQQSEYSFCHRLRRSDGTYAWVAGGAVPSFGPPGRTFLGYLGSLTEVSPRGSEAMTAYGSIGRFVPPSIPPATSGTTLERVADYLLTAHGLIEQDHAKEMLPVLREALYTAAKLLARNMAPPTPRDRVH